MSDKNFKVKNGIDAVGPITISPSSNLIDGLIINTPTGGKAIRFIRNGSGEVGSIDEWGGLVTSGGIQVAQPWYTRSPGIEAQSFFWAGSSTRSAAGFGGTHTGTKPVIYISSHSTGTNDLTQWLKPDNTIVAKVDYLGNITANDLTLSGNLTVNGTTTNLNSTNLVIEDKNIIIADVATPTNTTADGAGITIKGATDKTLNWVQSTGSFTSSDPFIINTTSTTKQNLIIKAIASQTANLQEWQDSSANILGYIEPSGALTISSNLSNNTTVFTAKDASNNKVSVGSDSYNRIFITAQSNPSASSFAGAYFTADGYEESWFNINTRSNTAGQKYMRFGNLGNKFLVQRLNDAANSITSTPFTIENTSTTNSLYINSTGTIINGTTALGQLTVYPASTSTVGVIIRGAASQSANLQEWQNSSGTVLAYIDKDGQILTPRVNLPANGLIVEGGTGPYIQMGTSATYLYTRSASNKGLIVKGSASQTENLQEWQRSNGSADLVVTNFGTLISGGGTTIASNPTINAYGAAMKIASGVNTYPMLIIQGAASQSANIQEWQNSAGTKVSTISPLGYLSINKSYTSYPLEVNGSLYAKDSTAGNLYIQGGNNLMYPSVVTSAGGNGWTSVTANYAVAPDGTTTATRYVWSTSGNCYVTPNAFITNIANVFYTASMYVKPNNSTSKFIFSLRPGDSSDWANAEFDSSTNTVAYSVKPGSTNFSNGTAGLIYVGNGWYRVWVTAKLSISISNLGVMFTTTQNNGDVSIWGIQLEKGYYASAYTPTTNAAVTATNNLYVPSGDIYSTSIQSIVSGTATLNTNGDTGGILINTSAAANKGLVIKSAASQTANIFEVQDSTGYPYFRIDSGFNINNLGSLSLFSSRINGAMLTLTPGYFGNVGQVIRGMSGQTADLQQWQNSAGTNLAIVDATGNITDASNTAWLSPIGGGSNDAPTIQALIDAGKKEIRLGSGQWTFSTRIKVPNGVTIRGTGTSRSSTTGTRVNAVALIASEGTVRDIMFTGAGENAQSELGGGGIAVLGGRVIDCSVTDSRWVLAPTRQPHGYLKNFMSRMQGGYGSVKVAILGDSLSENTSTTSWYGYLFDSSTTATGYYLGSYFGHQIAPSEVDNMAIGGQGAYLLSAQLAMTKDTVRTGGYVNQVLDGDNVSTAPFFNRNYNLAILAIGQNGGEDWKAHLEYTVKTIRDKGIDVIILTQNPAAGNPTSRAGDEYYYRSMAETYGCLLVDTQAYYRLEVEFGRALGTTADLFGDGIHQSALGHQLYAKAILNGILDYDSTIPVPANKTVVSRSYIPAQADRATAIAGLNTYYLVKKPDALRDISGVTYTTATDTSIRNPIYGRGTTTNSVATLATGGYANWGVEYATAAYIIYRENATTNTLTVSLQGGGSTLATLTTGVTSGRTSIQKVTLAGGYPSNRAIRITNTSGDPVQIYGVVFETHADVAFNRNTDGSYPGVKLNGSWAYSYFLDMSSYGGYLTPHTSTVNDSVTFKFYGDGLRFATSYGKNSGIIQVKIDDTTYTAVDTYLNIGEYGVYTHFYGGLQYGLHTATITLTGANAAVTGDLGNGARFGLHRIAAVRSSWYLTQDQQFAPNSDISAKVNSLASPTIGSTGGANIATFYNGTNGYGAGYINSSGTFNINGANMGFPYTSSGATLNVNAGASSITPLTVKGVSGQSANLQEWYNGAGQQIASISPYSEFSILGNSYFAGSPDQGARLNVSSSIASKIGISVRGVASQTANLQEWQDSSATVLSRIRSDGMGFFPKIFGTRLFAGIEPGDWSSYSLYSYSTAGNIVTLGIVGNASQTADLTQWKNSAGTVLASVTKDGDAKFRLVYVGTTVNYGAMFNVNTFSAANIGIIVQGVSSQTGDLQQWRNSSGTVFAKVDANGNFSAISKSFDIEHPTKENMRLRYASLEGPENGVYIRGTAESNIIELPDYWTGLVHEDSITVSLTAVGSAQNIYVEKIENNKVYIGGELTKAFFTVYGERKDIDKLTVEY